MADTTPRLALSWLMPSQSQKHVTVNETFGRLDALVQCAVLSRQLSQEPDQPSEGDGYILPENPAGNAWSNFAHNDLVYFQDGAWHRVSARVGLIAWIGDEASLVVYDGGGWTGFSGTVSQLDNLKGLGIGTASDTTNTFAAKLNTALWTALYDSESGTGDLRYTMNKQASGNVLSMVFQTGWSGRAEFGLAGNDDLTFKTSPDGSSWVDVMVLRSASGRVSLPNLPTSASGLSSGDLWNDNGTLKIA